MAVSKAAGSVATEAYVVQYVAGRQATENEAGGHFQQPSVAHFGAGSIGPLRDKLEPDQFMAVRAFHADGRLVQDFHFVVFHPHQLEAPRTTPNCRHGRSPSCRFKSCIDGDYHNIRRLSLSRA